MSKSEDQKRLRILVNDLIPQAKAALREAQRGISRMEAEAAELTIKISPKDSDNAKVSDHALIRYMERSHGFDFTPFREEILTPKRREMIEAGVKEINANGLRMKVEGKTIVTVI